MGTLGRLGVFHFLLSSFKKFLLLLGIELIPALVLLFQLFLPLLTFLAAAVGARETVEFLGVRDVKAVSSIVTKKMYLFRV